MNREQYVHVAVGVLLNGDSEVLIALRPTTAHQGGLWEFPGGKLERGESVQQALNREFAEELGIATHDYTALMQIRHDYGDRSVLLDVYRIGGYTGSPTGREGQRIEWRRLSELRSADFPEANAEIIHALQLAQR